MSNKNLGPQSFFLDSQGRSFETVVYRSDAPVSNAELNLNQEVQNTTRADVLKSMLPSGFVSSDLNSMVHANLKGSTSPNTLSFSGNLTVHVNGWVIPLEYTNTANSAENLIPLSAPPTNVGSVAVDFVYLEVWRALIDPTPSDVNKPSSTKIYRHGNVLSDTSVWWDDDIKTVPVSVANSSLETTRRVQVQYALRSVRLDSNATRIGYDDINVLAQGPNATPQVGSSFSKSLKDAGMFLAGDVFGLPNAVAGTVDGFVYSIPVCLVYRRNSAGFNFISNGNGGLVGLGTATDSDRPDGFYADQVHENDIQDLRAYVSPSAPDWKMLMDQSFNLLMDNELRSIVGQSSHTGFYVGGNNESFGTLYMKADDLLPSASADKASGNTFRHPDGICTVFSDRGHLERVVREFDVATHGSGASWAPSDTLTLDFVASNLEDEQPVGTVITDIISIRANDLGGASIGLPEFTSFDVQGLGTSTVVITLNTIPVLGGTSQDLWVEYEVAYPSGGGLTSMVKEVPGNYSAVVHNPSTFNGLFTANFTDDDSGRDALNPFLTIEYEQGPHREVLIKYRPDAPRVLNTFSVTDQTIYLPEEAYVADRQNPDPDITLTVDGNLKVVTGISDDGRTLTFTPTETSGNLVSEVSFLPHRPIPNNSTEMTLYYLAPAIQAIPFELLSNPSDLVDLSMELEPLHISDTLYTITASSGSVTTPYPFEGASQQVPVSALAGAAFQKESELNAPGPISIDDFDADVGMLKLPCFVPMALTENIVLKNPINVIGSQSLEYIDHYTRVDTDSYIPTAIAQSLSNPVEHKVFLPMIAKLTRDTDFGSQGSAVLVIFSMYYDYSSLLPQGFGVEENRFTFTDNMSAASLYRLKANPLTK